MGLNALTTSLALTDMFFACCFTWLSLVSLWHFVFHTPLVLRVLRRWQILTEVTTTVVPPYLMWLMQWEFYFVVFGMLSYCYLRYHLNWSLIHWQYVASNFVSKFLKSNFLITLQNSHGEQSKVFFVYFMMSDHQRCK